MSKGELAFVEWLRGRCGRDPAAVPIGIGDDMAAIAFGASLVLITSDMLLDTVHFDSSRQDLSRIGRKAIACSLSDCAAMACRPRAAVVSVALPAALSMEQAQRLYEGMLAAGSEHACPIVGGDTTSWSHPLAIDVAMLAEPMTPRGPVRRDTGRPGDVLLVTGRLGGSLRGRHLTFAPRLAEAEALAAALGDGLHAMMDVSDGLALDAFRLCRASGCHAILDEARVAAAASDDAIEAARQDGRSPRDHVLQDGEDFELLVAVDPSCAPRIHGLIRSAMEVGRLAAVAGNGEPGLFLQDSSGDTTPLEPRGYEHFR